MKVNPNIVSSSIPQSDSSGPIGTSRCILNSSLSELTECGTTKKNKLTWFETVQKNVFVFFKSIWNFFFGKNLNSSSEVKGLMKNLDDALASRGCEWSRCLYVVQSGDKVLNLCRIRYEDPTNLEKRIKHWLMKQDGNNEYSVKAMPIVSGWGNQEYLDCFLMTSRSEPRKLKTAIVDFRLRADWAHVPNEQVRNIVNSILDSQRFIAIKNLKPTWSGVYQFTQSEKLQETAKL